MTHLELVRRAEHWLLKTKGCAFVLTELVTAAWRDVRRKRGTRDVAGGAYEFVPNAPDIGGRRLMKAQST